MELHNLSIVLFSELIRKQMRANKPSLIRHRRQLPLFRYYPDVFLGSEAVSWAIKSIKLVNKDANVKIATEDQFLTQTQACSLYQKLMDAGLLQNVSSQEEFKNDKSLFRFASDDCDAEKLIRSVAIGYRLYEGAQCSNCNLFQRVCALGQLVSCECLKSCDMVSWLVDNGVCMSRELAVDICRGMVETDVLKPVDSEVREFTDGKAFYLFAVDYKHPPLTIEQFFNYSINKPEEKLSSKLDQALRTDAIYLKQRSDQLEESSELTSSSTTRKHVDRKKGLSTSSDDSGFSDNGSNISTPLSFQSLLNSDGSMTKAALFHPSAPYIKKSFWVYPDPLGYGFVIRGTGPCFVKIVDPDSPAGKAGLKALQYIVHVNRNDVTDMDHSKIEDLILSGPKILKITIMQHKDVHNPEPNSNASHHKTVPLSLPVSPLRQRSFPSLTFNSPLFKKSNSAPYMVHKLVPRRQVVSQ